MEEVKKASNEVWKKIKIVKAIDLINRVKDEPVPKFVWKGIPEGSMGLITGVAKTGKTTFAENLAISLSIGRQEFYGAKMDGVPRKVLFINLEEDYKLHCRRNLNQISLLNEEELNLFEDNYFSTPDDFPSYLNKDEDWEYMRDYILESKTEIVFIDSLSHMCIGEIEKSYVAQQFTQKLKSYIGSLNKTVIIVHHNTKGNDKPIDQDSIAGSRFILQEFEFAYGFSNIPNSNGGNYSCMLYNKHIEKDDTTAHIYRINQNRWVEYLRTDNKFNLYKPQSKDGRINTENKDLIYDYIKSQYSQGSQYINSKDLYNHFVSSSTMSKDTLYKKIGEIEYEGTLERRKKGVYNIKMKKENEAGLQNL